MDNKGDDVWEQEIDFHSWDGGHHAVVASVASTVSGINVTAKVPHRGHHHSVTTKEATSGHSGMSDVSPHHDLDAAKNLLESVDLCSNTTNLLAPAVLQCRRLEKFHKPPVRVLSRSPVGWLLARSHPLLIVCCVSLVCSANNHLAARSHASSSA
jgi:hypothetical protein